MHIKVLSQLRFSHLALWVHHGEVKWFEPHYSQLTFQLLCAASLMAGVLGGGAFLF